MIYYHATPPSEISSIKEKGLLPNRAAGGMEPRKVVWLSTLKYLHKFYESQSGKVVLEVDGDRLNQNLLEEDPNSFSFIYWGIIKPDLLRIRGADCWGLQEITEKSPSLPPSFVSRLCKWFRISFDR